MLEGTLQDGRTRRVLENLVDPVYNRLVSLVAGSRGIPEPRVREIAGGRVYAGTEAVELGLADTIGGLDDAIDYMRSEIEARRVRLEFRPRVKRSLLQRLVAGSLPSVSADLSSVESMLDGGRGVRTLLDGRPLAMLDLSFVGGDA